MLRGGELLGTHVVVDLAQVFEPLDLVAELCIHAGRRGCDERIAPLRGKRERLLEHRGNELLFHRAAIEQAENVAGFAGRNRSACSAGGATHSTTAKISSSTDSREPLFQTAKAALPDSPPSSKSSAPRTTG